MNYEITAGNVAKTVCATDMKIGEVGWIVESPTPECGNQIVLRCYSGLVSLTDPRSTWGSDFPPPFKVRLLQTGEEIIIRGK